MMVAPIYNPAVPFIYLIPDGMYPGRMIRFKGIVPPHALRFQINFMCGPNTNPRDDIAFHMNFRLAEHCVSRNHMTNGNSWGSDDCGGGLPIGRGQAFETVVFCDHHSFKVACNGSHFCEFPHRLPMNRITHLSVEGEVSIQMVSFEGSALPSPVTYQPTPVFQPVLQPGYAMPPPVQPVYGPTPSPAYGPPPAGFQQQGPRPPQGQPQPSNVRGMIATGVAAAAGGALPGIIAAATGALKGRLGGGMPNVPGVTGATGRERPPRDDVDINEHCSSEEEHTECEISDEGEDTGTASIDTGSDR